MSEPSPSAVAPALLLEKRGRAAAVRLNSAARQVRDALLHPQRAATHSLLASLAIDPSTFRAREPARASGTCEQEGRGEDGDRDDEPQDSPRRACASTPVLTRRAKRKTGPCREEMRLAQQRQRPMLLQPREIKRAKGELEGKLIDNVDKKERRRVESDRIKLGKVMIGSDASRVLECSETSETLATARRRRKKAKRSTKQAFDTKLLDKTQQEQHQEPERHLEQHDVGQVHEAAIEWMHQAPEAWAINVDTFALAVPVFPLKAHTFISQGGYARGLRLGFHRDLTILHAWSVDEQSIVLRYRFAPPSARRQACWSDETPVKQKLQGLARPLALLKSYEQESQVCLFLQRIKRASSASSSQLSFASSDGERFLQTLLPDGVDVVLLGRFLITDCHLVEHQTQGEAWHLRLTFKWSKSQGEPWFHASMTPREHNASFEGKDSNWTPSASEQRFDRCSLYPPLYVMPPTHSQSGFSGSPVPTLCSSIICPACGCATPRLYWTGWTCPNCKRDFSAPALMVKRDVYMGRLRLRYQGPRMDNGHCTVDLQAQIKHAATVWSDGIKSVTYANRPTRPTTANGASKLLGHTHTKAAAAAAAAAAPLMHHFLASGTWLDRADDLLERLIARDMPYERGSSSSRETANLYVSRVCGVKADCQQSSPQGLYTSTLLDLQRAPEVFLDVAQYADDATRRFAERPRNAIDDATICVGVKMDLQPLEHADLDGWLQLAHFGSDAHITLSRKPDALSSSSTGNPAQHTRGASGPRPRSRVIATWQLDHGDVLFVQDCKSLGQDYELRFHGKVGLSILALCRYLAPSP